MKEVDTVWRSMYIKSISNKDNIICDNFWNNANENF